MNNKPDILFLRSGSSIPRRTRLIKKELEKLGGKGIFTLYKRMTFYTEAGQKQTPKIFINDLDLKQFKVVFFRTIGSDWQLARLICIYLDERINQGKVKVVDPVVTSGKKYLAAKLCQTLTLKKAGLPVPRTYYGNVNSLVKKTTSYIDFPMVIKRSASRQGKEVYLARNEEEFSKLIGKLEKESSFKKFLVQEFIPNDGDLRLYVMGGKVITTIKRVRTDEDEFRNNLSQGAEAHIVKPSEEIKKIALKTAGTLGLGFAGVDIALRQTDKQPFILEVNRSPGYTSTMKLKELGVNISRRIAQYLIRLKKQAV